MKRALAGLAALSLAVACKLAYANATPAGLRWVLAPSCGVAARLGGLRFEWDPGEGFVCHGARMVVGPACAGVNFLVACALALYFTTERAAPGLRAKLAACAASFAGAYLTTALANGLRIALAARLGDADVLAKMADHAAVHRLIGVVVYAAALLAVCALVSDLVARPRGGGAARRIAIPTLSYLGVALVLPLCHRALGHAAPGLREHAAQTAIAFLGTAGLALVVGRLLDRLLSRRAQSTG